MLKCPGVKTFPRWRSTRACWRTVVWWATLRRCWKRRISPALCRLQNSYTSGRAGSHWQSLILHSVSNWNECWILFWNIFSQLAYFSEWLDPTWTHYLPKLENIQNCSFCMFFCLFCLFVFYHIWTCLSDGHVLNLGKNQSINTVCNLHRHHWWPASRNITGYM